jgi:UrcA family protein
MMSVRSSVLAVAAVAAGLATVSFAAVPAAAGQLDAVEVQYQDLNLANDAGRAALDSRISAAARQVCGDYMPTELKWREMARACQRDVIASAAPQRNALVGGQRYAALRVSRAAN